MQALGVRVGMARGRADREALLDLMVGTGMGPRLAARHLHMCEGTACSIVSRERAENRATGGRLAGYVRREDARCGEEGCAICAPTPAPARPCPDPARLGEPLAVLEREWRCRHTLIRRWRAEHGVEGGRRARDV